MAGTFIPDYSPKDVSVSWDSVPFTGFAEDFISVSPSSDLTSSVVGADGKVAITVSPDQSGTVEVSLLQNSPTNMYLGQILFEQQVSRKLFRGDLTITDPSGSFGLTVKGAHIMQRPEINLGIEHNPRTWTFFAEELIFKVPDNIGNDAIERIKANVAGYAEEFIRKGKEAFLEAISNNIPS